MKVPYPGFRIRFPTSVDYGPSIRSLLEQLGVDLVNFKTHWFVARSTSPALPDPPANWSTQVEIVFGTDGIVVDDEFVSYHRPVTYDLLDPDHRIWGAWQTPPGSDAGHRYAQCGCVEIGVGNSGGIYTDECVWGHKTTAYR